MEIVAYRPAVPGICEHSAQQVLNAPTFAVLAEHILYPVERLHDTHGRTVGPVEPAGRGGLEVGLLAVEFDRFQPCMDQHFDTCRYRGGKAEILGRDHAVDDNTSLIPARNGADYGAVLGHGLATGQLVRPGLVVKAAVDATQFTCKPEAV